MAKPLTSILNSVSPAVRKSARSRADVYKAEIEAAGAVKRIRKSAMLGQKQLADALGVTQPAVAKLERQKDMKLSTLMAIARAAGGTLDIRFKGPGKSIQILPSSAA